MRTKLLIAAAGLAALTAAPGAAHAQYWRHEGWYGYARPFPPPPPPPFYRPRAFYAPPPVMYAPPPPVYYAPPIYAPEPVYVAPRPVVRGRTVHRTARPRPVRPAAAAPCSCQTPAAVAPAAVTPALPALRPAPAAPTNNVYPPESTQNP